MLDEIDFDTCPIEEEGGQSGFEYGSECQRIEGNIMKRQVERQLGELPPGTRLVLKNQPYEDFSYYQLVFKYDYDDDIANEYANKLEAEWPLKWDEESLKELSETKYFEMLAENYKRIRL